MNELITKENINIEDMIYKVRGKQVMLDSDLAKLFNYETKQLNRQVLRNIERFPENYCFKLNENEYSYLRCQNGTLKTRGSHRKYLPYVFTEYGITMLAGVLKSDIAIKTSIKIINAFVAMRHFINENKEVLRSIVNVRNDIDNINNKLIEYDNNFNEIFDKLNKKEINKEYIFFNGQIYDSYSKIIDILNESKEKIIIIDSYADKILLDIISKINKEIILITKSNSLITKTDIERYNKQYNNLTIKYNNTFHDRYIIIDNKIIYHIGTSINHMGSKTFSINKLEDDIVINSLLDKIFLLL